MTTIFTDEETHSHALLIRTGSELWLVKITIEKTKKSENQQSMTNRVWSRFVGFVLFCEFFHCNLSGEETYKIHMLY